MQHQGLFISHATVPPTREQQTGSAGEGGRGGSQDRWPQLTKGIHHTTWSKVKAGGDIPMAIIAQEVTGYEFASGELLY